MPRRDWVCLALALGIALGTACTVNIDTDDSDDDGGGVSVSFTIANRTFTFTLGSVGQFALTGNAPPVQKAAAIPLFTEQPDDTPASGRLVLDESHVQAIPLGPQKVTDSAQGIVSVINVAVRMAHGTSLDPCAEGIAVGSYAITYSSGQVFVAQPTLDLPSAALAFAVTGRFTICLEASSDVSIDVTIEELSCTFGPPVTPDDQPDDEPDGGDEPECSTDADCPPGQRCAFPICVPDDGTGDDGTDDGGDDDPPPPVGFTSAIILHRGSEQLVAGPNLTAPFSLSYDARYGIADFDLSGDGSRVWFSLYDDFLEPGQRPSQLWSVSTSGSGGASSELNDADLRGPLFVATNEDGSICIVESGFNNSAILRASPGQSASLLFDTAVTGVGGCARGSMVLADDGNAFYYRDFCGKMLLRVDLGLGGAVPTQVVAGVNISNANGFTARNLNEFDITSDGGQWVLESEIYDSSLPALFLNLVHSSGVTTPTRFEDTPSDLFGKRDVHLTDDGGLIGYCEDSGSLSEPSSCYIQAPGSADRAEFSDGRTHLGEFVLSDDGTKIYARTNYISGPSTGHGFFQQVGFTNKLSSGSTRFATGATAEFISPKLSEDGRVFAAPVARGLYVLHDGVDGLDGFPFIDDIFYGYSADGQFLNVRVVVFPTATGIERIYVLPLYKGLEPTIEVPFEENPFFNDRGGGGVNWSTTFSPVEGSSVTWERAISLCDGGGNCKRSFITSDYRLRIVVVDGSGQRTVFRDFTPLP